MTALAAAAEQIGKRLLKAIAVRAAKDEESRQTLLAIILIPVVFVMLIAGFIVYILQHPLEALMDMAFTDTEKSWITTFWNAGTSNEETTESWGIVTSGEPEENENATYSLNFYNTKQTDLYINRNSPFAEHKITSKTGARNTGIAGASTNHAGVDRSMDEGTKIKLPIDVTYVSSGSNNSRGKWIKLKDENGYILQYQHLSKYGGSWRNGDAIEAGTVICYSGHTGVGAGYHLHEEYYTPDGKTNISEAYWARFSPIS